MLVKLQEKRVCDILYHADLRKRSYFIGKLKKAKQRRLRRSQRSSWYKPGRTDQWWQNMINDITPAETWKKNFRMPKETFLQLAEMLRPLIAPKENSPNNRPVCVEKK